MYSVYNKVLVLSPHVTPLCPIVMALHQGELVTSYESKSIYCSVNGLSRCIRITHCEKYLLARRAASIAAGTQN